MTVENERIKTPEEKYEEASFELAVYQMMRLEQDALNSRMSEKDEKEISRMANETMSAMLKMIDRRVKLEDTHKCFRKQGIRVLKTAAAIILILNMGLTIATAASSDVRAKVIHFLTEINDSYMHMGFSDTGGEAIIPEDWPENYFPTYIPEGYSVRQYVPHKGSCVVIYENSDGNTITIKVSGTDTFGSINTEGAEITYISLHGVTTTVLRQPYGETDIVWAIGDHYFVISSDSSYETALTVAQSMAIVQK